MIFQSKNNSEVTDLGPKGEIEFWRNRMQRLTSINEQLKRPYCKHVTLILSKMTKGSNNQSKAKIALLLRRWKQVDISVTEAANEAIDNVKYLCSLQRFMRPLYDGTSQSIIDILPALLNSVKVRHSTQYFVMPRYFCKFIFYAILIPSLS